MEFYASHRELVPFLSTALSGARGNDSFEVLVVGCGTSRLPLDLHRAGVRNVSAIDRSPSAVAHQVAAAAAARVEDLDFSCCDATCMAEELPDAVFDCIIDKACGDTLLCAGGEVGDRAHGALVRESARVCIPGGTFVTVSLHSPALLLPRLMAPLGAVADSPLWEGPPQVARVPRPDADAGSGDFFVYVARRRRV